MIKYFFKLYFEVYVHFRGKELYSGFDIGYYSSFKLAEKRKHEMTSLPGFCLHPISCFKIRRVRVIFDKNYVDKEKAYLYELTHECVHEGYDIDTYFGAFSTYNGAKKVLDKYKNTRFYKPYPEGFVIGKHWVNQSLEWSEGFTPESECFPE